MKLQKRLTIFLTALAVASLLFSSCSIPRNTGSATATFDLAQTMVVQTVDAQRTLRASSQTQEAVVNPSPVPPTNTPRPTRTPLVIATDTPTSLPPTVTPLVSNTSSPTISTFFYEDDFEHNKAWATAKNKDFIIEYSSGGYRINVMVDTGDAPIYSVRSAIYKDTRVEVDIIRDDGPSDNYFGLMCRYKNGQNYYRFVVGRDGYYNIGKKLDGKLIDLGSGNNDSAFHQGEGANRVRADCAGDTLALYLNGTKLVEVKDDSFTQGSVGLLVGTHSNKGADIYFDNFAISKP